MTDFKRISVLDAKALIDTGNTTVADIRDESAFAQSRLTGAIHLSGTNFQAFTESTTHDKPLIVYCYHGHSSQSAAQLLCEKGFADVYSMDGGFEQWRHQFDIEES